MNSQTKRLQKNKFTLSNDADNLSDAYKRSKNLNVSVSVIKCSYLNQLNVAAFRIIIVLGGA